MPQIRKPATIVSPLVQTFFIWNASATTAAPAMVMKKPTAFGYTNAANINNGTQVVTSTVNAPWPTASSPRWVPKRQSTATRAVTASALTIWKAKTFFAPNRANTSRYQSIGPLWNG